MNINGMVNAYMFVQFAGKKTAHAPVFRENPAVTRPTTPVKKDDAAPSTTVKTSDLGKATSSLDEVKTSVKALQEVSKINNLADAKKAAESFVTAFNKQQTLGKNLSDKNLVSAVQEPQQALLEKSSKELDALGIRSQADGTLALDETKLATAFTSKKSDTLINLGRVGAASSDMVRSQEKGLEAAAAPASVSPYSTASTQGKRLQEQQDAIKQLQAMNSGTSSGSDTYKSIYQLFG
ncbi:MAG: hypothetical protein RL217_1112 [Pseudomonadota bacterium]|jgi:hypothetical protein